MSRTVPSGDASFRQENRLRLVRKSGRGNGAAPALGKLGDTRGVEPLKELLGDEDAAVRAAAAEALKRLRGQSDG